MNDDFLSDSPLFQKGHHKKSLLDISSIDDDDLDGDDEFDDIFSSFPKQSAKTAGRRGTKDASAASAASGDNLNLDDILKDIDNEFFTDDAEKILDTERKHKEMASRSREKKASSDLFADLEDLDSLSDGEETYSSYALLEQLKGITGYKGSNITTSDSSATRQGPSNTMNSILWGDSQQQQQLQQQSLDDFARELEKTFELSDDEDEDEIIKDESSASVHSDNEEEEEEEEEEDEEDEEDILNKIEREINRKKEIIIIDQDQKEEEEVVEKKKEEKKEQKEEKKDDEDEEENSEDLSDVEVPIKTPKEINANLLELNLVSADSDDTDELFLSKRTPRYESDQARKAKEEEAIDGMTRMTVGEDPLSKPKLTAESALRGSVSTITSVPVSLSMTPLGISSTGSPAAPKSKLSSSPLSPSFAAAATIDRNSNSADETCDIEGVKFFRITTPLPQEWSRERKELIVHLKKYQSKLEDEGLKQQRKVDALVEERRSVHAKLTEELRKYISWHKPHLVRLFRKYVQLRLGLFAVQSSIATERSVRLMKKLGDVRTLRQEADVRVVVVDPAFYTDPLAAPPSPRDERLLRVMGKGVRAMGPTIKRLVLESSKVFSFSDRRSSLSHVLGMVPDSALKGSFFALDHDVQAEFDSWLLDARTQEGQQVAHFCSTVANPSEKVITPDDIVLFIDEFVGHIIGTYQIVSPEDGAKLAMLVQRALFPLIYEDVLRMYPEQCGDEGRSVRERDLELLGRLEQLREERHPGIQIDGVFWAKKVDPLVDAEKILAYLPFQLAPPDMIYILQKTITAICQVGKTVLHHNLAADEIVPLLVHTIVYASTPGLHEALFMMEFLSQDVDRTGEFGWCIAAFETALNHIDELKIRKNIHK